MATQVKHAPCALLAEAILKRAVRDWRKPDQHDELRAFFASVFCQQLCDVVTWMDYASIIDQSRGYG